MTEDKGMEARHDAQESTVTCSQPLPPEPVLTLYERPFTGRLFAYTATRVNDDGAYRLSIVVDGEGGHYPLSHHLAYGDEDQITELAGRLNRERLRLPQLTQLTLVAQSLRGPGAVKPLPRSPRRTYGRTGG